MSTPSGTMRVRVIRVADLSADVIEQMWQLFAQSYDDVTREQFGRDLAAKDAVFVGFDRGDDSFQGFSTFEIYAHTYESRKIGVLFSGDTMVRPAYWGQTALHWTFTRTTALWLLRHPFTPLYWFLTSMGYRTYLVMARNFPRRYWPRYDAPTPPWIKGLIASLATRRYGAAWDGRAGVIRFARSQGALASHVAPITAELRALPEIEFLVTANPEHRQGVELACVAQITLRDLARLGLKLVRRKLARRQRLDHVRADVPVGEPAERGAS